MLDRSEQINSKERYEFYKKADVIAYSVHPSFKGKLRSLLFNLSYRFVRVLRRYEYVMNCKKGILRKLELLFIVPYYKHLVVKCGYTIPPNVMGPGCSIHCIGTVIFNGGASVGENTRIHAGVQLGTGAGYANAAPKVGKNCYLGPGAKLFGDIVISDGTVVGANAVVNKSCEQRNVLLAGLPATVKKEGVDVFDFIIPSTLVAQLSLEEQRFLYHKPSLEVKKFLEEKGYLEGIKS